MNKPDKWGSVVGQHPDPDFSHYFYKALQNYYYRPEAFQMVEYIERYLVGVRSGQWTEEDKVRHVVAINELCPPWNKQDQESKLLNCKMEAVNDWLQKLADNDERSWAEFVRRVMRYNPFHLRSKIPTARVLALSPFSGETIFQVYYASGGFGGSKESHGSCTYEGGTPGFELLRELGADVNEDGGHYMIAIPPEAIKLIKVYRVRKD